MGRGDEERGLETKKISVNYAILGQTQDPLLAEPLWSFLYSLAKNQEMYNFTCPVTQLVA